MVLKLRVPVLDVGGELLLLEMRGGDLRLDTGLGRLVLDPELGLRVLQLTLLGLEGLDLREDAITEAGDLRVDVGDLLLKLLVALRGFLDCLGQSITAMRGPD